MIPVPWSARSRCTDGGLVSHSVLGGLRGAVIGSVVGNSVSRDQGCNHHVRHRESYVDAMVTGIIAIV